MCSCPPFSSRYLFTTCLLGLQIGYIESNHTHTQARAQARAQAQRTTHKHKHKHTHEQTHMGMYTHWCKAPPRNLGSRILVLGGTSALMWMLHIYICTCVCIYIHTCLSIYICIHIYVCIIYYVYIYTHTVWIYVYTWYVCVCLESTHSHSLFAKQYLYSVQVDIVSPPGFAISLSKYSYSAYINTEYLLF